MVKQRCAMKVLTKVTVSWESKAERLLNSDMQQKYM
jgi:hypothetical protein